MGEQHCTIYVRAEAAYVFPEVRTADGQRVLSVPMVQEEAAVSPSALGAAVLRALDASGHAQPRAERRDMDALVRPLGFRTFGRFERGTKHLIASRAEDGVTITPWNAYHGGWSPEKQPFVCAASAEAIGLAMNEALRVCTDDGKEQVPPAPELSTVPLGSEAPYDRNYPVGFGSKIGWIALRTRDTYGVVDALRLKAPRSVGWRQGIDEAYGAGPLGNHCVFVSPAVNGWTLVVGYDLPDAYSPSGLPFLAELSREFGEAQYFGTHRGVDYQVWAKAVDGAIVRAYANGGGGVIDIGPKSAEEIALGFDFLGEDATEEDYEAYEARDKDASPDEEHVVTLAGRWSVDPTQLEREESQGFGVVGEWPGER